MHSVFWSVLRFTFENLGLSPSFHYIKFSLFFYLFCVFVWLLLWCLFMCLACCFVASNRSCISASLVTVMIESVFSCYKTIFFLFLTFGLNYLKNISKILIVLVNFFFQVRDIVLLTFSIMKYWTVCTEISCYCLVRVDLGLHGCNYRPGT